MTTLYQVREIVSDRGTPILRVESTITNKGALPDPAVFLYTIGDPEDPKTDVYSKVIDAASFLVTTKDRPTALITGSDVYRVSTSTLDFYNVDDGATAAAYIRERVNALAQDWDTLQNKYLSSGEEYVYPVDSEGVLAPLIAVYVDQVAQVADLREQYDAQAALCAELDTTIASATARRTATADAATAVELAHGNALSVRQSAPVEAAASSGDKAALDAAISSLYAQLQTLLGVSAAAQAELAAATSAKESCTRDLAAISAVIADTSARAAMTLAEIQARCPSYAG